jgi:hypothetical protein
MLTRRSKYGLLFVAISTLYDQLSSLVAVVRLSPRYALVVTTEPSNVGYYLLHTVVSGLVPVTTWISLAISHIAAMLVLSPRLPLVLPRPISRMVVEQWVTDGFSLVDRTLAFESGNVAELIRKPLWMATQIPSGDYAYYPVQQGQFLETFAATTVALIAFFLLLVAPMVALSFGL